MVQKLKRATAFMIVFLGFLQALMIGRLSFHQEKFVSVEQLLKKSYRAPASLKRSLARINFGNEILVSTSPQRMLAKAELIKGQDSQQMILGHFSTKDSHGDLVFACQVYDRVTLNYEVLSKKGTLEKSVESNPLPQLQIEAPCRISESDVRKLEPVVIKPQQFLSSDPMDGTYPLDDKSETIARLSFITETWPTSWSLRSVTLTDSSKSKTSLEISASELEPLHKKALELNW